MTGALSHHDGTGFWGSAGWWLDAVRPCMAATDGLKCPLAGKLEPTLRNRLMSPGHYCSRMAPVHESSSARPQQYV